MLLYVLPSLMPIWHSSLRSPVVDGMPLGRQSCKVEHLVLCVQPEISSSGRPAVVHACKSSLPGPSEGEEDNKKKKEAVSYPGWDQTKKSTWKHVCRRIVHSTSKTLALARRGEGLANPRPRPWNVKTEKRWEAAQYLLSALQQFLKSNQLT